MRFAHVVAGALALGTVALFIVAPNVDADEPPAPCAWQIEYALNASLALSDTPMGEGDGSYRIGPGTVVLRYEDKNGEPAGNVQMLSYAMREHFTIKSKTLFWTTTVLTDTSTAATPDACAVVAAGTFDSASRTVRWRTPVRGYHTDGTLTCKGSLCGKFNAPPPGQMALHIGPSAVSFSPFVFSADRKTFAMASTHVAKTSMPKQSSAVTLAGREVRRACVPVAPCSR